jgi:hypothetical protein
LSESDEVVEYFARYVTLLDGVGDGERKESDKERED